MFNQSFVNLSKIQIGIALAFLGYTSFAFSDAFAKYMAQSYSVYQVIFMSNVGATLCLLLMLPKMGGLKALTTIRKKRIHALRAALNVSVSLIIVHSFTKLPIADVYTFIFAMPFYAALLAIPLYGERIPRNRLITILIGFAGVLIALQPGSQGFDPALIWPLILGVIIAFMFTLAKSLPDEPLFSLGFWPVMANVVVCGGLALYDGMTALNTADVGLFIVHGACIAIGILGVSNAFRVAPASAAAPILYCEMIWAILLGYWLFGDVPKPMMMIGASIIVLSGLYLIYSERRTRKKAQALL